MDTSYERKQDSSQEWYTPKWIIDALGHFDLDPCAPIEPPYIIADKTFDVATNGLTSNWGGQNVRVFCNPPYKHPLIDQFIKKLVRHGNGIALIFDRCDSELWHKTIFPNASGLFFMQGRVKFLKPHGETPYNAGCGSVLVSFGDDNAAVLKHCNLRGTFIDLRNKN